MNGFNAFVTGIGLLGSKLVPLLNSEGLKALGLDLATDVVCEGDICHIDITDLGAVKDLFQKERPEVVFHTAALTNVDKNETDPDLARKVNVVGTRNIALAAKEIDGTVILVSTDFVFDGKKGMYKETDGPNPINVYGRTKLEGELELAKVGVDHAIARTSVLYGSYRLRFNFVTWVIDSLKKGEPVRIVTDQYASPTLADDLAQALFKIYRSGKREMFHTGGGERISRYDLCLKIAEVMGLDASHVTPITTDQLDLKAKRPMDSSLDVSKLKNVVGHSMMDMGAGLKVVQEQEQEGSG